MDTILFVAAAVLFALDAFRVATGLNNSAAALSLLVIGFLLV